MNKKLLVLVLVFSVLALLLSACGNVKSGTVWVLHEELGGRCHLYSGDLVFVQSNHCFVIQPEQIVCTVYFSPLGNLDCTDSLGQYDFKRWFDPYND
jgi:hypothetical protein